MRQDGAKFFFKRFFDKDFRLATVKVDNYFQMEVQIELDQEKDVFRASCPSLDIHCFGLSQGQALVRLKLVMQFYMETARERGLEIDVDSHSVDWEKVSADTRAPEPQFYQPDSSRQIH